MSINGFVAYRFKRYWSVRGGHSSRQQPVVSVELGSHAISKYEGGHAGQKTPFSASRSGFVDMIRAIVACAPIASLQA